jgi:hypothetical protein
MIYHHPTNGSIINHFGNNHLVIRSGNRLDLRSANDDSYWARFVENGAAELYHDGNLKFSTEAYGTNTTGTAVNDGLVVAGVATVTTMNVTGVLTYDDVTSVDSVGIVTARQGVRVNADSGNAAAGSATNYISVGASQDLKIYHDGSHSRITNNTGFLALQSNQFTVNDLANSEGMIRAYANGAVELYHNGIKRLETTQNSVNITGNLNVSQSIGFQSQLQCNGDVNFIGDNYNILFDKSDSTLEFADNARLRIGVGNDLQIFHNGTDTRFTNNQDHNIIKITSSEEVEIYKDQVKTVGITSFINMPSPTGGQTMSHTGGRIRVRSNLTDDPVAMSLGMFAAPPSGDANVGLCTVILQSNSAKRPELRFDNIHNGNWHESNGNTQHLRIIWTAPNETSTTPEVCELKPIVAGNASGTFSSFRIRTTDNSTGLQNVATFNTFGQNFFIGGSISLSTSSNGLAIPDNLHHYLDTDTRIRFPTNDKITIEAGGTTRLQTTSIGIQIDNVLLINGAAGNPGRLRLQEGGALSEIRGVRNTDNNSLLYFDTEISGTTATRLILDENGHLKPATDGTYDLGRTGTRWRDIYTDDIDVSGNLLVADSILHTGDTDTKIRFSGGDTISLQTGGNERLLIQNAAIYIRSGMPLAFLASSGATPNIKSGGTNNQDLLFTSGSGNPTRLQITSGGNIGINEAAPSEKLQIDGDILLGGQANASESNYAIKFEYNNHQFAKIVGDGRDSTGYGDIDFYTSSGSGVSNLTQRMTIRADGNVGINEASPDKILHISHGSSPTIRLENTDTSLTAGQVIGNIEFKANDGSGIGANVIGSVESFSDSSVGGSYGLKFRVSTSSSANYEAMRIAQNGYISFYGQTARAKFDLGTGSDSSTISNTAADYQLGLHAAQSTTGDIGRNIAFISQTVGTVCAAINSVDAGTSDKTALQFLTGNSSSIAERLRINHNGNIGINYSGTPTATLDIRTDLDPTNGVMCFLRNNTNDGNGALYGMDINGCGTWSCGMLDNSNNFSIVKGSGNSGDEYFRIDSGGRLLLRNGSTTSTSRVGGFDPALQVEGTSAASASIAIIRNSSAENPPYLLFGKSRGTSLGSNTAVASGDILGNISFNGSDGSGNFGSYASIYGVVDNTPGNSDHPGRLSFYTTADGGVSPEERVRIDSQGDASFANSIYFAGNQAGISKDLGRLNVLGSGVYGVTIQHGTSVVMTNEQGQTTQAMVLGDTSSGTNGSALWGVSINNSTSDPTTGSESGWSEKARVEGNGDFVISGSVSASGSDDRLKKNKVGITSALSKVCAMEGFIYEWNDVADKIGMTDGEKHLGLSAQTVEPLVPEVVVINDSLVNHDDGTNDYKTIKYERLVPLLVEAIKDLKTENDSLKTRISALEGS